MKKIVNFIFASFFCFSCGTFAQNLTFGKIQQVVQKGVTKEKILEDLGSPNMVTGSSTDQETWIYDKISTTVQLDAKSEGTTVLGGVFGGIFGVGGKSSSENISSNRTTSQRTLTLIIKFKGENVESFATRMSNF